MFVFLTWGILVTPASLLVKLVMFFLLSASAFGITLIMTTESPLADAVLKAPWDEETVEVDDAGTEREEPSDAADGESARPLARTAGRAAGRSRRAGEGAAAGHAGESADGSAG